MKKKKHKPMNHFTEALPEGTEVQVGITYIDCGGTLQDITVTATVTGSLWWDQDQSFHYDLQAVFTKGFGNNSATVQIKDVHPSLIIAKEP